MNKNILAASIMTLGVFSLLNGSFAQDVPLEMLPPIKGSDMKEIGVGHNSPDRVGYILNLCPKLVQIDHFEFGNQYNSRFYASLFRYNWQVNADVVAFSISTIEYDPFGNPLPRSSWVLPTDDESSFEKPIKGRKYVSDFAGAGTSADLIDHLALDDYLPLAKSLTKLGFSEELAKGIFGEKPKETHEEPKSEGTFGRSTRFTVVTFVSSVCYKEGDKIVVWKANDLIGFPDSSITLLPALDLISAMVLYSYGKSQDNQTAIKYGLKYIHWAIDKTPKSKK